MTSSSSEFGEASKQISVGSVTPGSAGRQAVHANHSIHLPWILFSPRGHRPRCFPLSPISPQSARRRGPACAAWDRCKLRNNSTVVSPIRAALRPQREAPEPARRRRPAGRLSSAARTGDTAWRAAPPRRPLATPARAPCAYGTADRPAGTCSAPPKVMRPRALMRWPDSGRPRCAFVPALLILPDRPDRTVFEARLRRRVSSTMRAKGPHCADLTTCPDANG